MLFFFIFVLSPLLLMGYYVHHSKLTQQLHQRLKHYHQRRPPEESSVFVLIKKWSIDLALKLSSFGSLYGFSPSYLINQVRYAGWLSKKAPDIFLGTMVLIALSLTLTVILLITLSPSWSHRLAGGPIRLSFTIAAMTLLCTNLPKIALRVQIKRYNLLLMRELPQFFELYILNVASGFSSIQSWENTLYLMGTVYPKTSEQIDLLISELRSLSNNDAAWANFISRINNQGIRDAIHTMHQCELNGIPLGKDLYIEIEQINKQYLSYIEKKVAKLPTYMLLPIFVFIFPSLFIITIGPAIISVLYRL